MGLSSAREINLLESEELNYDGEEVEKEAAIYENTVYTMDVTENKEEQNELDLIFGKMI